jgi:predicted nuclease of predicted toxin-antitoxin system
VTFYIDASIQVAVAAAISQFRTDVLYAGGPGAPAFATRDTEWLALAGRNDWVVLTRDKRIRTRPAERDMYLSVGVRTFCFTHAGNYTSWEVLELVVSSWRRIEEAADATAGPYIYSVTKAGLRWLAPKSR